MFKLIKLAIYAMIGYAIYEMFQGMKQQQGGAGEPSSGGFGGEAFGGEDRGAAITGPGEGVTETAKDFGGGAMRHTVGRGVVRR